MLDNNDFIHMKNVARYMYDRAETYGEDPEEMYTLGLLHDIGKLRSKGDHPHNGMDILCRAGAVSQQLLDCIGYHESTPGEYMKAERCESFDIPGAMKLMWEAELRVDDYGNVIRFHDRLNMLAKEYGTNSPEYERAKETMEFLRKSTRGEDYSDIGR